MHIKLPFLAGMLAALIATGTPAFAETLEFAGYTWEIRPTGKGGPGPNEWDPHNAWVDSQGALHLKLTHRDGKWYAPEVYTQERLGFGRYQFWLTGGVDKLDPNIVFGIFNYPTPDVGPDKTHEIDIEFAHWGNPRCPIGNYTVWPAAAKLHNKTKPFPFTLKGDTSTHRFTWTSQSIAFESLDGHTDANGEPLASWICAPDNPTEAIAQKPMPLHLNLWCFKGGAPTDGREAEVIVRSFKFTPQ